MNKFTKSAIAGSLVMFLAGSSVFATATSTSTTTIKSSTANGVTTTTTTTTTKTTETTTTTATTSKDKNNSSNKNNNVNKDKNNGNKTPVVCDKKDHKDCKHETKPGNRYGNYKHNKHKEASNNNKVANCPHIKPCKTEKECEQLKARSAKLPCNGKPDCKMHAGTYYDNKYHKVTETKNNDKKVVTTVKCTTPVAPASGEKPLKKLPSGKVEVESKNVGYKITIKK